MHLLLQRLDAVILVTEFDESAAAGAAPVGEHRLEPAALPGFVRQRETADRPRWVWSDTRRWYPELLAAGVRVERCHDLRLTRAILRLAPAAGAAFAALPLDDWDAAPQAPWWLDDSSPGGAGQAAEPTLFELAGDSASGTTVRRASGAEHRRGIEGSALDEFRRQLGALAEPGSATSSTAERDAGGAHRLRLLLAAESAGALVAAELEHFGLPWSAERHDALLTELLGPRPAPGRRPERLEALLAEIRALLGDPALNPDSPPELLKRLRTAGLRVRSTSKWELRAIDHPAIPLLLDYKRRARLMTAHGWNWLDQWVHQGRFHPRYVVGGVVTGRWATDGGGAMQLPAQLRGAIVADPGWRLVVADAAQLEPRILSAMAQDGAMLRAGAAGDLYQGIVDAGAVATREQAKYGMLGALYGGTRGESGRMLPRLARAFPHALALVEQAARQGERDEPVRTWLGRGSPRPSANWERVRALYGIDDDPEPVEAAPVGEGGAVDARGPARRRAWGRFTRNFVVQGTAAEWAMSWMALLRGRLLELGGGEAFGAVPRLAYFLHDEVIVHTPAALAEAVAAAVRESAQEAGRLLFGAVPVRFELDVAVVEAYDGAGHGGAGEADEEQEPDDRAAP